MNKNANFPKGINLRQKSMLEFKENHEDPESNLYLILSPKQHRKSRKLLLREKKSLKLFKL